ncbi:low temperature requirement protein A [Streptomyces sp. B1866]|uniref:low temperature requirement protein A n=1 Tax=Streptomyces sp. B1866 TaxID=3075431 RepID=UPI00288CFB6E|nr:low temperature requirement protein A [Streptomyces sp. B1866]MDT3395189.1 low temperature requirement protein A [Streptomyces sp. B1866]
MGNEDDGRMAPTAEDRSGTAAGTGRTGRPPGGVVRRAMRGRDPREAHRAATPLELLFDLMFVVAVAQAAAQLHHALAEGHLDTALTGYPAVFFAIWWAWLNFAWFASAYDTDDVPYRLLTLVQMAGVLVLAAGVRPAFEDGDFAAVVAGYVIMRAVMITQWLRAAAGHPEGRTAALRYAAGVAAVQAGWIARLWAPGAWAWLTFLALVSAELAVPVWAEYRGRPTAWHAGHIAERYGLFTLIVLGEVILAALTAVESAVSERGVSGDLVMIAVGGLLLVFSLWWIYFTGADPALTSLRAALAWGYGHYLVFASVAALGAGLETALDVAEHRAHLSTRTAALSVAVPVVLVLLTLYVLHRLTHTGAVGHPLLVIAGAAVVAALALAAPAIGAAAAVLGMGLTVAATLTANLVAVHRGTPPGEEA